MKFSTIFLLFVVTSTAFTQSYKFAWLSDIHIGSPDAEQDLLHCVQDINFRKDLDFVVATGDIAEKGRDEELRKAKELLDKLNIPYYIIPGNHDTKWSESGNTIFPALWGDNKFFFVHKKTAHIGLNTGVYWRGGGGHVIPEDLHWLDSILTHHVETEEIYFYTHHPLDGDVDNWFKVTNILKKKNIRLFLWGHGHANRMKKIQSIPGVMGRSTLSKGKKWGYTIAENYPDSVLFFESNSDTVLTQWGTVYKSADSVLTYIDSVQTKSYDAKIIWEKDYKSTLSAPLLVYNNKIYAAFYDGTIRCLSAEGEVLWQNTAFGTVVSKPAAQSDILIVGTIEGELITYDANTGKIIQSLGTDKRITSQLTVINTEYQGEKTYGVVFGCSDGSLYNYDIFFLNLIWENTSAKGMIETKPLYINNRLVYGSWDNYLYCVDARSGILNWSWTENQNFYYSPAAAIPVSDGESVYISTPDKYVSSIDLLLGKTNWRKNNFNAWESISLSPDNNTLYIKSIQDKVYAVEPATGKQKYVSEIGFGLDTMPVEIPEHNGAALVTGKPGMVWKVNPAGPYIPLLFLGTARAHTPFNINGNHWVVSNMDGKIVCFTP